jgi:hypothetical protein
MAISLPLTQTTISSAMTATQSNIRLTSTTGVTDGDVIKIGQELVKVETSESIANPIPVLRGWNGTQARAHAILAAAWHATPDEFRSLRQSADKHGLTGNGGSLPDYCVPGTVAYDGLGNKYVAVQTTEASYAGATMVISNDALFSTTILAAGAQGRVGIAVEQTSSDEVTWLLREGYYSAALESGGTSDATSLYVAVAATSVSTPEAGMAVRVSSTSNVEQMIYGMFITGVASSATTSATSSTGITVPVLLDNPYTYGFATTIMSTASVSS